MKLEKWNEKAAAVLDKLCATSTRWMYASVDNGVVFTDTKGHYALFCDNCTVVSAHDTKEQSDYLRKYWKQFEQSKHELAQDIVSGKFQGEKGRKIVKLSRDGMDVYLDRKYYNLFPKNTLFYTESPTSAVLAGIWENDRLHIIGFVLPVRLGDNVFEVA